MKKSVDIWVGVNKNKSISMHTEIPHRDEKKGQWVSNSPFINSIIYQSLSELIEKTEMSWMSDCEVFQIAI